MEAARRKATRYAHPAPGWLHSMARCGGSSGEGQAGLELEPVPCPRTLLSSGAAPSPAASTDASSHPQGPSAVSLGIKRCHDEICFRSSSLCILPVRTRLLLNPPSQALFLSTQLFLEFRNESQCWFSFSCFGMACSCLESQALALRHRLWSPTLIGGCTCVAEAHTAVGFRVSLMRCGLCCVAEAGVWIPKASSHLPVPLSCHSQVWRLLDFVWRAILSTNSLGQVFLHFLTY